MHKFSIRSIIIGIGIGVIITSSLNLIFHSKLDTINNENEQSAFVDFENDQHDDTPADLSEEILEEIDENKEVIKESDYIEVDIPRGLTTDKIADLLFEKNIINDAKEFTKIAHSLKLTNKLHFGVKALPKEASVEEILAIIASP
ncbi:hypothetical protein RH915_01910 [Serpentinicella sp. ANB-PHB4]|uniref:hypothetical protein n=1 Tax=Serpentinicella sp. ANB-PHB4 TaxID=3074076 RepID=UPI00285ADD13|nr:hypothetical protein [Serpentinicella sp. ANB-PHB4]MDR5658237.1 hypothetical protein [Serpentinicella sp. ANB-PHB4]